MIGHLVPHDNKAWHHILQCLKIVDNLCAHSFTHEDVLYLKFEIESFNLNFQTLFPDISIKPKRHYSIHFPSHIEKYGPMISTWTIRYEAMHEYYKDIIRKSKQHKNITKTMAEKRQRKQAIYMANHFILDKKTNYSKVKYEYPLFFPNKLRSIVTLNNNINSLEVYDKCVYEGITYSVGFSVIIGIDIDEYKFGKICYIVKENDIPFFYVQILEVLEYSYHYHSYVVNNTSNYEKICILDIYDYNYQPLAIYNIGIGDVIVLKHYISF